MLQKVFEWLSGLPVATTIAVSSWMFPTIESIHVVAITLVVGSVVIMDLRLLGITSNRKPVTELATEVLPWTWGFFVVAFITGTLMVLSKPMAYYNDQSFWYMLLFILLAGVNMAVFHLLTYRSVSHWDRDVPTVLGAKIAGVVSLAFWITVIFFGRWIGYTIM